MDQGSRRPLFIKADLLIDGNGGTPIKQPRILIDGNRFEAVAAAGAFSTPPSAEVVDCEGCTLIPGMMDLHVHVAMFNCMCFQNHRVAQSEVTPQLQQMYSLFHAQSCLDMGFTLLRDCGMYTTRGLFTEELCAVRDAINAGIVQGPRLLVAAFTATTGSHLDLLRPRAMVRHGFQTADSPWDLRKLARRNLLQGCDVIKTCASGGFSASEELGVRNITQDELDAVVDEAHGFRKQVAVHALSVEGQRMAVKAGVDTIEHMVFHDEETTALIAKAGIPVTPTLLHRTDESIEIRRRHGTAQEILRRMKHMQPSCFDTFKQMHKAGVKIIMGTDIAFEPAMGMNAGELAIYVQLGMSPMDALLTATRNAAEALRMSDQLGTVERGKLADLVAVEGNPLQDITCLQRPAQIKLVMKDGKICTDRRKGHAKSAVYPAPGSWKIIDE